MDHQAKRSENNDASPKWAPIAPPPSDTASIGCTPMSETVPAVSVVAPVASLLNSSKHLKKKNSFTKNDPIRGTKRPRSSTKTATASNTNEAASSSVGENLRTREGIHLFHGKASNESAQAQAQALPELPVGVTQLWNEGTAVLTFSGDPVHVCLIGRARLEVRQGEIDVLGYRLTAADAPNNIISVDSPPWRSVVTIVPTNQKSNSIVHITSLPAGKQQSKAATFKICCPRGTEVRPTVIPHTWQRAMNNIVSDLTSNVEHLPNNDDETDVYGGNFLDSVEEEKDIDNTELSSPLRPMARIAICGAKGVGKSTCLRFAAHRLLSHSHKAVALLDCDAGQPEMSPPGMLTLTIVRSPLLRAPHAQMVMGSNSAVAKEHEAAYYFGHITSKADPTLYVTSISKLVKRYEQLVKKEYDGDEYQLPLLVNTDGWVKGMGFQVLSALMDVIQPRHVVQLIGENRSKIFDLTDVMNSLKGSKLHVVQSYNNANTNLSTNLVGVTAASRTTSVASLKSYDGTIEESGTPNLFLPTPANAASIPSMALRSLRMCTYFLGSTDILENDDVNFGFTGIFDPNCRIANHLACAKPYAVSMDAIDYNSMRGCSTVRDFGNDHDTLLDALNGSIVGLCRSTNVDDVKDGPEEKCNNRSLRTQENPCLSCLGLGLIRSIDRVRRLFFILTPIPIDALQSINILVGGNLQLPMECFYRGIHSESFPYLCCDGLSVGLAADVMESKNNLSPPKTKTI